MQRRSVLLGAAAAIFAGGMALTHCSCSTIEVNKVSGPPPKDSRGAFSHADFNTVLKKTVNAQGKVDYEALRLDHAQLDRYLGLLAATSPDNDKSLFPNDAHKLAYWLNAYNACVIKQVIEKGITDSVGDSVFKQASFFVQTRFVLGGESISLRSLEDDKVRTVYDARVHFALNCASGGCPRLRPEAFDAADLDAVLEDCAKEFCNEDRNVKWSRASATVTFSKIFDWYKDDFLEHARRKGISNPTLRDCVNLWRPADKKLPQTGEDVFLDYDWTLNAQKKS
ncbi:MAG: DUF547 domain-containing protein [Planctomycetes bacterium]|nr:DUF547 domain-containing protein [Planctomycetota bacterium]